MSIWKNNPFFKIEDKDPIEQEPAKQANEKPQPDKGGSEKTSFTRRLPELSQKETRSTPVENKVSAPQKISSPEVELFTSHFDGILSSANLPSPNYFTFARMLSEMAELPDGPKYKSAFAALKVQGLSKDMLISSANAYLGILDQDNKGFKDAVDRQEGDNVKKIQDIRNSIQTNLSLIETIKVETEESIRKLTENRDAKIKALVSNNNDAEQQVNPLEDANEKIQTKVENYDIACSQYKQIIQDDLTKIQTLIN